MKVEIDLPDKYDVFLEYLETYFFIDKKIYLEKVIISEIESRNHDLKIDVSLAETSTKKELESIDPVVGFLEKEPNIYTDEMLKVKYNGKKENNSKN